MWSASSSGAGAPSRYGLPHEMGMFVVAPATPFHHPDGPLISGAAAADPSHSVGAIQFWQNQQPAGYFSKPGSINFDHSSAVNHPKSVVVDGGGGAATTCQDCGNQAKKDCSHSRCRTCCRSRGFDCSTHVKSTWVPASRRRERQMIAMNSGGGGASSGSTSGAKKPRLVASQSTTPSQTSNSNTPSRSFDTTSSHQADGALKATLPRQVRAPAVFKCVRVTAMDEGDDDEFAYQAVVRIGGHVFKGFLYDQGAESADGFPNLSELHLGGGGGGDTGGAGVGRNGAAASSSAPLLDPYTSIGGILGASNYGNTLN